MKEFVAYQLVDRENFCNLIKERRELLNHIDNNNRVVIYAPRNYGKTSLVKNILVPEFKKKNKNSFVFFIDLLEVKDMDSLIARLINSFERSFENSFPVKNIFENIKKYLKNIKPEISIDPVTSLPSLSLKVSRESREYSVEFIFSLISEISKKCPTLIVMDEFQDISNIAESQAIIRTCLEDIKNVPILLLGSKMHILSGMFSKPDSPFSFWGIDFQIPQIDYKEYQAYIQERFDMKGLTIKLKQARFLQDLMWRIPEAINILCKQILDDYEKKVIFEQDISLSVKKILESKEGRYESYLSGFSAAEESVCVELAKSGGIKQPQSKDFTARCRLTNRSVGNIIKRFMDRGIIEMQDEKYRLTDPLLHLFLRTYR